MTEGVSPQDYAAQRRHPDAQPDLARGRFGGLPGRAGTLTVWLPWIFPGTVMPMDAADLTETGP